MTDEMIELTSSTAATIIYGTPGMRVRDKRGREIWVDKERGYLVRDGYDHAGALSPEFGPFTQHRFPKQQVRLSTFGFRDTDVLVSELESQQKAKAVETRKEVFTGIHSTIEDIARRIAREEIENSRINADGHYTEMWRIYTR